VGSLAAASHVRSCIVVEDVTQLRATLIRGGVKLSWDWPANCHAVVITRRQGAWPEAPHDSQATIFFWALSQYHQHQEGFRDTLEPDTGEYFYIVYALRADAPELAYAPGTSPGCRCRVRPRRIGQLTYSMRAVKKWLRSGELELRWQACGYAQQFSGFVIVGNGRGVPQSLEDGVPLWCWAPQNLQGYWGVVQRQRLNLRDLHLRQPTGQLYYKLFLLNPVEQETLLVQHPDVNRPLELS